VVLVTQTDITKIFSASRDFRGGGGLVGGLGGLLWPWYAIS